MSKMWTIGITHLIAPPFTPETKAFLETVEIVHFPNRHEEHFNIEDLKRLDAFLVWTPSITRTTATHLSNCKILVRYGVGFDKIDLATLNEMGIKFSNNPGYGPHDVADTALGLILTLQRHILEHDIRARNFFSTWQENFIAPTLHSPDTTVGLVGLGRIGSSVAKRLKPFHYNIIAVDPFVSDDAFSRLGVERANNIDSLISQIDILTLHCPLTEETKHIISKNTLDKACSGLILINTARGGLIDSLDTIEYGLKSGVLSSAGLDVLPEEPPGEHSLISAWRSQEDWIKGRLIIQPHNAFYSNRSIIEARYRTAETAALFLEQDIHRYSV